MAAATAPLLPASSVRSDGAASSTSIHPKSSGSRPCEARGGPAHEAEALSASTNFDVVLLFPNVPCKRRTAIAARCRFIGLEVVIDHSRDDDELLLKLSAPDELLEEVAEHITMEKRLKVGGYTDFTRERMNQGLFQPASDRVFFSSLERSRLILATLELGLAEGGCDIDLDKEIADGVLLAVVPIHDASVVEGALLRQWALAPLKAMPDQPLDEIRDYFGEQIAFYFAFVQTLTTFLIPPSIVGLVVLGGIFVYGSADNPLCPLYSLAILVWIGCFCKAWRREESRLAFRWNVEDFEDTERPRPEFVGPLTRGFYSREGYFIDVADDDKLASAAPLTKRFAHDLRERRMLGSFAVVASLTLMILVGVVGVLSYRSFLQLSLAAAREIDLGGLLELDFDSSSTVPSLSNTAGEEHVRLSSTYAVTLGSVIGGVCNSVFISVTNALYAHVASWLNEWENHRTETAHADALILKTFCFQFVNSYASLFYIAFIKAAQLDVLGALGFATTGEYCHDLAAFTTTAETIQQTHHGLNPYCMGELSTMLTSLVITSQVTGKLSEFVLPRAKAWYRAYSEEQAMRKAGIRNPAPLTYYERQCKLEPFEGVFDEYNRLIIQVGYIVLFAPAFPIASLVCYISFLLELRTDAYKLLANTRRPRYAGAQDIGSWQRVLFAIGLIGTFTNLGLIGYTSTAFSNALPFSVLGVEVNASNKAIFLFLCEHVIVALQFIVQYALPDYPESLAMTRAELNWRRRATIVLAESGGKPMQVDGNDQVKVPPVAWDDSAIPECFWLETRQAALMTPRQGREWAHLVKAGDEKGQPVDPKQQEGASAVKLVTAKDTKQHQPRAAGGRSLVSPAPLPPPGAMSAPPASQPARKAAPTKKPSRPAGRALNA